MADYRLHDSLRYLEEGSTPTIQLTIEDEAGVALPLAQMLTMTLFYWNKTTGKSINGRIGATVNTGQNVLNLNNCTYAATSGLFSWNMQAADTAMQSPDPLVPEEVHVFRLEWTYTASAGTKGNAYKDEFFIERRDVLKS